MKLLWPFLALLAAGCLRADLAECGDLVCPPRTVCAPAGDRCVASASVTACAGRADQEACTVGGREGACRAGVCDTGDAPLTLHVALPGPGTGRVVSQPAGIDCGATCSAPFRPGTRVVLTATPSNGSAFTGWSGPCSGADACELTVTAETTVSAIFLLPPAPTITDVLPEGGVGIGGSVVILGTDFTGATAVTFNGTPQPTFTVVSPTRIETTVPPGARPGPISVTAPGGVGTSRPLIVLLADVGSVTGLESAPAGCVELGFTVEQAQSLPANVRVEIDPGTGAWMRATPADGSPGLLGLATSPQGVAHTFRWNTTRDLPGVTVAGVKVRVSASVANQAGSEGRAVTRIVTVANGPALSAAADEEADDSVGWWAVGDVDRDGDPDVIMGELDSSATLLRGDGRGGFAGQMALPLGDSYVEARLADVNTDGRLDLVLVSFGSRAVSVRLGNGDGTFREPLPLADSEAYSLDLADLDRDGRLDLVCGGFGTVAVALGRGDGTFAVPVAYPTPMSSYSPAIGDVDRDGRLDLVMPRFFDADDTDVRTYLGDGKGGIGASVPSPAVGRPYHTALADVDGDGKLDFVTAGESRGWIQAGAGDGSFGAGRPFLSWTAFKSMAIDDVNLDGRPDILVLALAQRPAILVASGDGRRESTFVLPDGIAAIDLAVADVDRDGRPDVLVRHAGGVLVMRNTTAASCDAAFQ